MIHHVSVGTNDIGRARMFYDAVLPVLGLSLMKESESAGHYGSGHLILSIMTPFIGAPASAENGSHIAFSSEDRAIVNRFYELALAHGGTSDGEPGVKAQYGDNYYGAFVRDPDGNKIEAVTYSAK